MPASGTLGHGGRFDRQRHQVFALQMMHVRLAAGTRKRRQLHRQDIEVIRNRRALLGRQPLFQSRVLRRDADRAAARVAMMAEAGRGAQAPRSRPWHRAAGRPTPIVVLLLQPSAMSTPCPIETASAPMANALATSAPVRMPPEMINCTCPKTFISSSASTACAQGRQRGNAGMLDKHLLRGGRAALHAVDHDDVGAGFDGQLHVARHASRPDLHVDRHLPVGDLPQFLDLDRQVVRAGPIRMPAGRALIDSLGQASACRRRAD